MSGRLIRARLRALAMAAIFATTSFAVAATPAATPQDGTDPLGKLVETITHSEPLAQLAHALHGAVAPQSARAYCASNATFTGWMTTSPTSHTAVKRTKDGTLYAYISKVGAPFSCTAFYRYSGLAWNTTASAGKFDYGNLINSTSVSCNYVAGTNDYVKANPTTDCPDSDAEYAMAVSLTAERRYVQDIDHNTVGDISFVHASCSSYYESNAGSGEKGRGGEPGTEESFSGSNVANRPGANCAAMTIDGLGASPAVDITYDKTAPTLAFSAPAAATGTTGPNYTVTFNATDAVAKFAGSKAWTLKRQVARNNGAGACDTFADDTGSAAVVTGTTSANGQTSTQAVTVGYCYRWILSATDQNDNVAAPVTSATLIVDGVNPALSFATPYAPTVNRTGTSYTIGWVERDAESGINTHSLQRYKLTPATSACSGTFVADGSADTNGSPRTQTLANGACYHWTETITDKAARSASCTSSDVYVDSTYPSATFTVPTDAALAYQSATSVNVTWSESTGGGTISSRSLQRQKASGTLFSGCSAISWSDDGAPDTGASPRNNTSLTDGLYRWIQTLTNSGGKTGTSETGWVAVDTTAPTGSITSPAAYTPVSGDVAIEGTADDAISFKDYTLEYGAGTSPGSWTTIGTYTNAVPSAGTLGTWSPGPLSGVYTIRLTVRQYASATTTTATRTVVLENSGRGSDTYRTRVPYELAGGWTLDVGVANGEARLARDLFSIPSYGPAQALSLASSSAETGTAGRFGAGWSSNLTQYLTFDVASAVTTWHRADGALVPFGLVGSTWTPPRGHYETMSVAGSEVTITTIDQTRYVFATTAPGRLKRIENRFGKALTLVWNTTSATATDASGRATTIAIDSTNDRITSVTDSAGRAWTFAYTGTGTASDLTCITDPGSKVTRLGYTAHQLTTISRGGATCGANGTATWTVAYASGKTASVKDPLQTHPDLFTYATGATTASDLTDDTGSGTYADTVYAFDAGEHVAGRGIVGDETDPTGVITSRIHDADGNVTRESIPTDSDGTAQTDWTYDTRGNVTSETTVIDAGADLVDPVDDTVVVTTSTYNATNDLTSRTEADNDTSLRLVTRYTYDGSGHLTSENRNCTTTGTTILSQGAGGTCTGAGTQNAEFNVLTTYAYTANDQLEFEQDPLGRVIKHVYDANGNETSVIANCTSSGTTQPSPFNTCTGAGTADAATNVVTSSAFSASDTDGKAGLPTSSVDALGRTTTYDYDALGRLKTTVLPDDASIPALTQSTAYDEYGDALTEADSWTPSGGTLQTRTTTHAYDALGRETSVADPEGVTTLTTYDIAGNAVETRVDGTIDVVTTRQFDDVGQVTVETAGSTEDGQETAFAYSPLGVASATATSLAPPPNDLEKVVTLTTTSETDLRGLVTASSVGSEGVAPLVTTTTYDKLGNELTVDDPDADSTADTTSTYDRLGRLLTSTVGGRTTTYTYDRAGNQLTVTDPAGIVSATTYDALNRATVVVANDVASPTLPSEDITTRTYYDAVGNAAAVKDATGITTRTILNARDQAVTTIANCTDSGTTPTSTPASCTGAGTHNDATNVVTDRLYDGQGSVVKETAAVGRPALAVTETAYDDAGKVLAIKDPRGTITINKYNLAGQLIDTYRNCTHAGTTIPTTDWAICDAAGTADGTYNIHTTYAYDDQGRQTTVTAPNGRVTVSEYDDGGNLARTIDNYVDGVAGTTDDITTEFFYDAYGRLAAVRTPTSTGSVTVVTRTTYNTDGTVASEIRNCTDSGTTAPADPAACTGAGTTNAETNVTTAYGYDTRGNRVVVTAPDPSATTGTSTATVTTQSAFDAAGRLCRVVENAIGSTNLQALTNPCTDATQTSGTLTTNLSTKYGYDGASNMISMTDAAGHTTTYSFDALNHPTGKTDALGGALVWAYDPLGNRTSQRNRTDTPPTLSVTWTYDPFGRILTRTADSATTTSTYDANGNKLTVSDGTLTITATYDRLDRVLTVDDEDAGSTADTTYTYSLTTPSWTDPSGGYAATLDKFDRQLTLDEPADAGASNLTWTYRADGQPSAIAWPNGNTTDLLYDKVGRLTSKDTTASSGTVNRALYDWTYNRAGQVLTDAETVTTGSSNGTITYGYDALGQLTGSTLSGTTTSYGWDKVPNRTSVQVGAGTAASTTYDAADRPTSGANPTAAYTSNADGMLTARPNQTLIWDHLGRLTTVKNAAGTVTLATYTYDPLDRLRTAADTAGARVRFRYVALTTSVAQWWDDVAGTVTRSVGNDWSGERVLDWTGSSSNLRFYGTNAHHDVTWLASNTGTVSQSLRYDPFGNARAAVPSGYTPFRFQGSWYDANSDLSWVVTRWYAPTLGRFVSEDSLLGQPAEPDSRHLYAYAAGEPVGAWDPDGRASTYRSIPNRAGLRGRVVIGLFIADRFNYLRVPLANGVDGVSRFYGDNRTWSRPGGECYPARGCITIDFDRHYVKMLVNRTCTDVGVEGGPIKVYAFYGCNDAFAIRELGTCGEWLDGRCNMISVNETRAGVLRVRWDITQSRVPIIRPDMTVNGYLEIWPGKAIGEATLYYFGDGFPSEEAYYYGLGGSRSMLFQHSEGSFFDMREWAGNWHTSKTLPRQVWRTGYV